ncbi:hypothetical protein GLOIN_2v1713734 [Rhizophagus irregularis DAOM 181602=DAOM 197198]|nr:hypothetical protein GLOIN_2v1713734 [Rhizophagus irregularis DAOM 181602=DAOM 197198]
MTNSLTLMSLILTNSNLNRLQSIKKVMCKLQNDYILISETHQTFLICVSVIYLLDEMNLTSRSAIN